MIKILVTKTKNANRFVRSGQQKVFLKKVSTRCNNNDHLVFLYCNNDCKVLPLLEPTMFETHERQTKYASRYSKMDHVNFDSFLNTLTHIIQELYVKKIKIQKV